MSFLRRALLLTLLPVVWLPIIGLTLVVAPSIPLWAWPVAVLVYVGLWRRRSDDRGLSESDPDAARFAPIRQGGY